jgi:hypothetical protein
VNFKRPIHTLIASIVVFSITSSVQAESPFSKMKDKLKSKVSAESNEQAKDKVKRLQNRLQPLPVQVHQWHWVRLQTA